jgi:hypothetical protein
VILHHLVFSKLPFSGKDYDEVRQQIAEKELNLEGADYKKVAVHPACKDLILGMLCKD